MRIGSGYDVHRLVRGRSLIIGGVSIPYKKGLMGHSDADVLIHAICDAILGAAGLGDIGQHFPDSAPEFKDACSMDLLKIVNKKMHECGLSLVNMDATIIAEEPKIAAYRDQMITNIAKALEIEPSIINIKATTNEGLGFIGKKEGVAASCVVLLD